jgi:hypothetical protein
VIVVDGEQIPRQVAGLTGDELLQGAGIGFVRNVRTPAQDTADKQERDEQGA